MPFQLKEDRKYPRLKHTPEESRHITLRGMTPVVSSNVSAVGFDDKMLIVRFHGGATYAYPKSGELYKKMLDAPSKGKFVWNELRRKNVPYYRTANINLENDVEDRDIMKPIKDMQGETLLIALALDTMISQQELLTKGIIAGIALATMINQNAEEAEENSRQA